MRRRVSSSVMKLYVGVLHRAVDLIDGSPSAMSGLSPYSTTCGQRTKSSRHGRASNDATTSPGMVLQFGARGRYFITKSTQKSNDETHGRKGIIEGSNLPLGVLGVGERHGNTGERDLCYTDATKLATSVLRRLDILFFYMTFIMMPVLT